MQSFAGAETTRGFSSILNSTWPMRCRQPKYAARNAVEFTMGLEVVKICSDDLR
jgi:hypothetical protein